MTTVNVGQAKSDLSRLIALAESGEDVEIARDGVPVVRLVPINRPRAGEKFLSSAGALRGDIIVGEDFEFSDAELDDMFHT